MVWIPIWQRCIISHTAQKDAQNKYGKYLKTISAGDDKYPLSVFMQNLVDCYEIDCKKAINRRKSIPKLYSKIVKEYETIRDMIKIENTRTEQLRTELNSVKIKLESNKNLREQLNKNWSQANETGMVTTEMGVSTLSDLKQHMELVKEQVQNEETSITHLESEIYLNEKKSKEIKAEKSKAFYKYINKYRYKIDNLYKKIDNIGNKYEKKLYYYWRSLIRKLDGLPVKQKSFSELCQLAGKHMLQKSDLFPEERNKINLKMKQIIDFEVDI